MSKKTVETMSGVSVEDLRNKIARALVDFYFDGRGDWAWNTQEREIALGEADKMIAANPVLAEFLK